MKSKVLSLYDYRTLYTVPEEDRLWRVRDEEIEDTLKTLSENHAHIIEADEVKPGDCVKCCFEDCHEGNHSKTLFLFPDSNLYPELEEACLFLHPGDTKSADTASGIITFTVDRILRLVPFEISDALVKLEEIDGVETLKDYREWYRREKEPIYRRDAITIGGYDLFDELCEKSLFELDPDEQEEYVSERARLFCAMYEDEGPQIDDDGNLLTPEEFYEQTKAEFPHYFQEYVLALHLIETLGGESPESLYQKELTAAAEDFGVTEEEAEQQEGKLMLLESACEREAARLLEPYIEAFLEK